MRRTLFLAAASLSCLLVAAPPINADPEDAGLFARFDAVVHPADLRDWMKRLASEPNHVGSPHDRANAEWILAQFKSWGWDAHIESFDVLYPTPIHEALEMVSPASLQCDAAGAADSRRYQRARHRAGPPRLSRLSGRRRCARRTRLRELRHEGRLQRARAPGGEREGTHRHRPLWSRLARPEAEARLRARRHRLHHLFRSAGRRLWTGCHLSGRPHASAARHPARLRGGQTNTTAIH